MLPWGCLSERSSAAAEPAEQQHNKLVLKKMKLILWPKVPTLDTSFELFTQPNVVIFPVELAYNSYDLLNMWNSYIVGEIFTV